MKRYIKNSVIDTLDADFDGRLYLAENPNTSPELLDELAKDKDYLIRLSVACNPNTSESTLRELSKQGSADIRYAVAEHKNTPRDILLKLSGDSDWYTRNRALKSLGCTSDN